MKHRWGKGKKGDAKRLPNGAKIEFVTVGGRTSAVVPSVQKKTGPVAGDVKNEAEEKNGEEVDAGESADLGDRVESATKPKSGKMNRASKEGGSTSQATPKHLNDSNKTKTPRGKKSKTEPAGDVTGLSESPGKKRKAPPSDQINGDAPRKAKAKKTKPAQTENPNEESYGRRRSARVSGRAA